MVRHVQVNVVVVLALALFLPAGCATAPVTARESPMSDEIAAPHSDEVSGDVLPTEPPPAPAPATDARPGPTVEASRIWGMAGGRGFVFGDQVAANGEEFKQLFSLDLDFNIWLWQREGLYLFADARFWGQKAAPGITNSSQGPFDFSKREFDFNLGSAWNYYGNWEARLFAYSFNNLNRGTSTVAPSGFNDGTGLENRYYLGSAYGTLGTPDFDQARTPFVGVGYYPSKTMVDGEGVEFKPGVFAHVYLTLDLLGEQLYLYTDDQLTAERSCLPKLLHIDSGLATRPFARLPRLEFRLGTEDTIDLQRHEIETGVYGGIRYVF